MAEVDDRSVGWCTEIGWEPGWTIESSVVINDAPEQRTLAEYPMVQTDSAAEFVAALRDRIQTVRASVAEFDFVLRGRHAGVPAGAAAN